MPVDIQQTNNLHSSLKRYNNMKKVFVSICIAGAALAMSSCRSVEKAIPLSSINGEWNIIEVNGSKITPG